MVATILEPEISSLESQLKELQAQIAATQARMAALDEAESVAGGALQGIAAAVEKIAGLAPNAIARFWAAVMKLNNGGDDSSNGGGNLPIKQPNSPNGNGHSHKPDVILGKDIVEVSAAELAQHLEEQVAALAPELNGQFSELVCFLEDAPSTALTGQSVEILCPIPDIAGAQDKPYIELVQLSQILAYQRLHNGEIPAAYIAFKSKTRAEAWGRWLVGENNIAAGFEVRAAKRILGLKWEIKLWGISIDHIQRLGKIDFNNAPNDQALSSWLETASPVEQVQTTQHPTIDPTDVPVGVSLRSTDDDFLIEYIVWATVIARDNGVPKPTQKQIGRLVLGNGIEAYRPRSGLCQIFTKTMDAVVHLIGGAGYRMTDLLASQEMREITQQEATEPETVKAEILPEVIDTEEVSAALSVGSSVQITSARHGEQMLGQVGTITAATPVGCVVVIGDLTRWFCTDEVQLAEKPVLVEVMDGDEDIEF